MEKENTDCIGDEPFGSKSEPGLTPNAFPQGRPDPSEGESGNLTKISEYLIFRYTEEGLWQSWNQAGLGRGARS